MGTQPRELAIVTGASTGIGFELARLAVENGFDLLIAADEPAINEAKQRLARPGVYVEAVEADLSTREGVEKLYDAAEKSGREIGALLANAGRGAGKAFLDQEPETWRKVVDTNIVGTLYLVHRIGRRFRQRDAGRILITGSIAGFLPGAFQAVYNGSKAFIDSFADALRNELKDTKVTVTCLMPGATETEFFERADLMDSKIGTMKKDDPGFVAKVGFDAMMAGQGDVISGWKNKLQVAAAHVLPSGMLAEAHRKQTAPGTADS
jgi:short-subunit dehydrogenase